MSEENNLNEEYLKILQTITNVQCSQGDDKYSGVFLPFPNKGSKITPLELCLLVEKQGGGIQKIN